MYSLHESSRQKVRETIGTPRLLLIGSYRTSFEVTPGQPVRSCV